MSFLKNQKYHLAGIGILTLAFVISVIVRKENLNAPMGRHHEWITAHSLITADIWDKNGGPSAYGFNPVYTYKGSGNAYRRMLGGVTAEDGNTYYVSYPPFAFIFLHYSSQLLGGPSVKNIRIVSVFIHFLTALFLYLLIASLSREKDKKRISYEGIAAGIMYLFAHGNLWFHGNLYFSDMLLQPLFIASLYLTVRWYRQKYKSEKRFLVALFIVFFLATYTEWLGLLTAFFTGITFLITWLIRKEKRFLKSFLIVGIASAMALGTTLVQYSSIAGWDELKTVSEKKYAERSGHSTTDTGAQFNIHEDASFDLIGERLDNNYDKLFYFLIYISILTLILFVVYRLRKSSKNPLHGIKLSGLVVLLMLLGILTHYLLFFNFNTLHDFSGMKTSSLFIVIGSIFLFLIYQFSAELNKYIKGFILTLVTVLLVIFSIESTRGYLAEYPRDIIDYDRIESAEVMSGIVEPEKAVFTNIRLDPIQDYYVRHAISPVMDSDTSVINSILELRRNIHGQFFYHEGSKLIYMVNVERQGNKLLLLDTLNLNPDH